MPRREKYTPQQAPKGRASSLDAGLLPVSAAVVSTTQVMRVEAIISTLPPIPTLIDL